MDLHMPTDAPGRHPTRRHTGTLRAALNSRAGLVLALGLGLGLGLGLTVALAAPPLTYDPPAIDVFPVHERIGRQTSVRQAVADGQRLFEARFNIADGAGRPYATSHSFPTARSESGPSFQRIAGPDANSCAGCHNQPAVGGSGDFAVNVFVAAPQFGTPLVDSISEVFSNERNTRSLFGTGAVEMLAREMTAELLAQRQAAVDRARAGGQPVRQALRAKGIDFGAITLTPDGEADYGELAGVSPDLVIKPFGSKGTVASLREFTIVALNQHHGIQPVEFFGEARTGTRDFDQDGVPDEFSVGQTTALTLFQAALPAPDNRQALKHPGFGLFKRLGCDACHVPVLHLKGRDFTEPSPYNRAGVLTPADNPHLVRLPLPFAAGARDAQGWRVEAFTDLKRHEMCDARRRQFCNETKKQDKVPLEQFMTTRLWDLATSAPYGHRGDMTTITEAIEAHGGEAAASADAFDAVPEADKRLLIAFLRGLGQAPSVTAKAARR